MTHEPLRPDALVVAGLLRQTVALTGEPVDLRTLREAVRASGRLGVGRHFRLAFLLIVLSAEIAARRRGGQICTRSSGAVTFAAQSRTEERRGTDCQDEHAGGISGC